MHTIYMNVKCLILVLYEREGRLKSSKASPERGAIVEHFLVGRGCKTVPLIMLLVKTYSVFLSLFPH